MDLRTSARPSLWFERACAGLAGAVVAAILAYYVVGLFTPLPVFAADAGAYLIRALYPDEVVVRNPLVTAITNGVHLSLIRAAYRLGALTGAPYIPIDKAFNALIYLAGLVAFWRASVRGLPRREQATLLIVALGFAYYRFAFSNLAEGPFVGLLALVCLITLRWYRSRPAAHALAAGVACAALVLAKPHGMAMVCALGAVAVFETAVSRTWLRLPLRVGLFAAAFLATGNLIQFAAQEPVSNPMLFYMSPFYSSALDTDLAEGAGALGLQALGIMGFSALLLAGAPAVLGAAEIAARWRMAGGAFRLRSRDIVFLLLLASLAATIVMAAIFEMKVASTPSETRRLWGRYFEFYAPMLWLAAAPVVSGRPKQGPALACGALTLVGVAGLLGLLQRGWIVLPWDSAVLTAFFEPDPQRAPVAVNLPYRGLATAASLLAAGAFALRARPAVVAAALLLTLSGLSTWLDHVWLGDISRQRYGLEHDLRAIAPKLPAEPARVVLITPDANLAHLGFLRLGAQPYVVLGEAAHPPSGALAGAAAVVASGSATPGDGAWTPAYRGQALSLWRPAAAPALPSGP